MAAGLAGLDDGGERKGGDVTTGRFVVTGLPVDRIWCCLACNPHFIRYRFNSNSNSKMRNHIII